MASGLSRTTPKSLRSGGFPGGIEATRDFPRRSSSAKDSNRADTDVEVDATRSASVVDSDTTSNAATAASPCQPADQPRADACA